MYRVKVIELAKQNIQGVAKLWRLAPVSLVTASIAPVVAGLLLLWQAWLMSQLIAEVLLTGLPSEQAGLLVIAIAGLLLARAVIAWMGERAASFGAERIKTQLRTTLFLHLLMQGPYTTRFLVAGELSSTLIDQIDVLDGFFIRYLPSAIAAGFLPLAFGIVLLPIDWVVALLLLLTAPLIPVLMALIGWGAEAASRRHQTTLARLSGYFADRLRGLFTLRLLGRSQVEVKNVRQASLDLSRKTMVILRLAFLSSAALELFAAIGVAGVALYIGLSFLGYLGPVSGPSSLQAGLFCLLLAPEVYSPLRQFAANYHDRAAARAVIDQIQTLFGDLPVIVTASDAPAALVFQQGADASITDASVVHVPDEGRIRVDASLLWQVSGITVMAQGRCDPILRDVSLTIQPGQKIALMGSSGSGKTTLLEVLMGLRAVRQGQVFYYGHPLQGRQYLSLRDGVVLASQQPFFMPATLAENLRLANAQASDQQLWLALQQAGLDATVKQLPQGLDTLLGVGGYGLSGGQLHSLSLARVFLSQASVLLLDEPTAHLDNNSRDRVIRSLLGFSKDKTLLVATHDAAVAHQLDRVWQVQDQQVIT